jgi:hypothetical protein
MALKQPKNQQFLNNWLWSENNQSVSPDMSVSDHIDPQEKHVVRSGCKPTLGRDRPKVRSTSRRVMGLKTTMIGKKKSLELRS